MAVSTVTPSSSSTALMICTQVVAIMPPNKTYMSITTPTATTATSNEMPNMRRMRFPAPTICAVVYTSTVRMPPIAAAIRTGACCKRNATTSANVYLPRFRSGSATRNMSAGQPTSQPVA